ncbi:MAG: choice-of-anchor V domain-containing protein [Bacteroidales bacterium]
MKKNLLFILGISISCIIFLSFGDTHNKYQGGSPGGYAGAPPLFKTCKNCHSGQTSNVTDWITTNIPATGYIPGTAYTVTVTVTGTGKKGFEVTPRSSAGTFLGSLTAGTGNKLVDLQSAVTQNATITSSPATWSFTWTAPNTGTGNVTFYGAFSLGLLTTKLCTLNVQENTIGILDQLNPYFSVYPNPCTDHVNLNAFLPVKTSLTASLYSLSGSRVITLIQEDVNAGECNKRIDIPSNLAKGTYLIYVKGNGFNTVQKILVH